MISPAPSYTDAARRAEDVRLAAHDVAIPYPPPDADLSHPARRAATAGTAAVTSARAADFAARTATAAAVARDAKVSTLISHHARLAHDLAAEASAHAARAAELSLDRMRRLAAAAAAAAPPAKEAAAP